MVTFMTSVKHEPNLLFILFIVLKFIMSVKSLGEANMATVTIIAVFGTWSLECKVQDAQKHLREKLDRSLSPQEPQITLNFVRVHLQHPWPLALPLTHPHPPSGTAVL